MQHTLKVTLIKDPDPLTLLVVMELQSLECRRLLVEIREQLTGIETLPGLAHKGEKDAGRATVTLS